MSKISPNSSVQYEEGKEEDYTDKVRLFMDAEAVRPGSSKMRSINVKPITVNCFKLLLWYLLDSLPFAVDFQACCTTCIQEQF